MTYHRLNVTIYASDREVIRRARLKLNPNARTKPEFRDARHAFYRQILKTHKAAQNLAREFRL